MFIGNKEFWDEKFLLRGDKILLPDETLVENINLFKKGSILDLACGDGRNSIFLAENDFEVTAIDFSEEAIKKLNKIRRKLGYDINIKQLDLSKYNALDNLGVFDNIVINHYRAREELLSKLYKNMRSDGILFINGFGYTYKVNNRMRKEDLIQESDFQVLKNDFKLIKYIEKENEIGFFVTYIFKRL